MGTSTLEHEMDILTEHGLPITNTPHIRYYENPNPFSGGAEYVLEADRVDVNMAGNSGKQQYLEAHELAHKGYLDAVVGGPEKGVRDTIDGLESARDYIREIGADYAVPYQVMPSEDLRERDFETAALIMVMGDELADVFEAAYEHDSQTQREQAILQEVNAAKQAYASEIIDLLDPVRDRAHALRQVPRIEHEAGAHFWETYRRGNIEYEEYVADKCAAIRPYYKDGEEIVDRYQDLVEQARNQPGTMGERVETVLTDHVAMIKSGMEPVL